MSPDLKGSRLSNQKLAHKSNAKMLRAMPVSIFKCQYLVVFALSALCDPYCRNEGICIGHNVCSCPKGFSGKFCQLGMFLLAE